MLTQEFAEDVVEFPTRCPRLLSVMAQVDLSPASGATGVQIVVPDGLGPLSAACQPRSGTGCQLVPSK